ncbi:MAG: thiamine diphosphokinase [Clostridiales bacterium]|nr:thiamine diphosphokinase [Clostridiales bacterium]
MSEGKGRTMSKAYLLVLGGDIRDDALFRQRLGEADEVLVADSGARHMLRLGFMPEQIYGDLDSLTPDEIKHFENNGCHFIVCPSEKNETDSGIVLREVLSRGSRDIRIWCALGGRPDHSYANLMLLQFILLPEFREIFGTDDRNLPDIVIEDGGVRIFLAKRGQQIEGKVGEYVSFFALSPEVTGFRQQGLKYQPDGDRFISGFPLGVSNEFMQEKVWIDWDTGILLCMLIDGSVYQD